MTSPVGPSTPPPPAGPGRPDLFGDYDEQLHMTGCEVIDPLLAAAKAVAAAAPPLPAERRARVAQLLRPRALSLTTSTTGHPMPVPVPPSSPKVA